MPTIDELKNTGLKATQPRLKILDVFHRSTQRHITAEDVFRVLLDERSDIGLATVYRVLTQFEQAGILIRSNFESGKAELTPTGKAILDEMAVALRKLNNRKVDIIGHTDSTGSDAINNPLSLQRAESTRNYLTARGVNGARIQVQGMGSHQPVASNATNEGRARNRRVAVTILSGIPDPSTEVPTN